MQSPSVDDDDDQAERFPNQVRRVWIARRTDQSAPERTPGATRDSLALAPARPVSLTILAARNAYSLHALPRPPAPSLFLSSPSRPKERSNTGEARQSAYTLAAPTPLVAHSRHAAPPSTSPRPRSYSSRVTRKRPRCRLSSACSGNPPVHHGRAISPRNANARRSSTADITGRARGSGER